MTLASVRQWPALVLVAAEVVVLGVAFGLVLFAHPQGDDFCRAVGLNRYGFPGAVTEEYKTWSGRFASSTLIYGSAALIGTVEWYGARLAGVLSVLLLAFYMLVTAVLGRELSTPLRVVTACSLLALHWTGAPDVGATYYWWTAAVDNQLNVALAILLVACLVRMPAADRAGWWVLPIVASVSIVSALVVGTHELYGVILVGVLAIGTFIAMRAGHPNRVVWTMALAGAVVGLALVLLSPGNRVRMAVEAQRLAVTGERHAGVASSLGIGGVVALAGRSAFKYLRLWVFDVRLLSATVVFALGTRFLALRPTWLSLPRVEWRVVFPLGLALALGVGFLVPTWLLRSSMPQRTLNVLYLVFLVGWFLAVFVWTRWPDDDPVFRPSAAVQCTVGAAMLVFALSLVSTGNTPAAVKDLLSRAPNYDRTLRSRYRDVRSAVAAGESELRVARVADFPESFFDFDIMEDVSHPEAWRNRCFAEFAGLRSVSLKGDVAGPGR